MKIFPFATVVAIFPLLHTAPATGRPAAKEAQAKLLAAAITESARVNDTQAVNVNRYLAQSEACVGDMEQARTYLAKLPAAEQPPTLALIAGAQAQNGDIEAAKSTAASIKDPFAQIDADLAIARVQLARNDKPGEAATLAPAVKLVASESNKNMQEFHYRDIARLQLDADDFPGALATAKLMDNPDTHDEGMLITALIQARSGDPRAALETVGKIASKDWQSNALVTIADAQLDAGKIDEAKATIASAKSADLQAEFDRSLLKRQLADLAKKGDAAGAKKLAANLPPESALEAATIIATAEAANGDAAAAQKTLVELNQPLENLEPAYKAVAGALIKAGNLGGAKQCLAGLKELAIKPSNKKQDELSMAMNATRISELAVLLAEAGDADGAIDLVDKAQNDPYQRLNAFVWAIAEINKL